MEYIAISMLNEYAYCPKSAWYALISGKLPENVDTVEGALLHQRAHSSVRTVFGDVVQARTVLLYSDTYGLTGIGDLVEEKKQTFYPVEYKKGRDGDWKNHQVQLCAQALCLEEMLQLRRRIRQGYLYYMASGKRRNVRFSRHLRRTTVRVIEAVRNLKTTDPPPPVSYGPKCPRCSKYTLCLPQEVKRLKKRQRWR